MTSVTVEGTPPTPILLAEVRVPVPFCVAENVRGSAATYGGDIRVGDLRGTGDLDFLVYRSVANAHDGGGMKPCFIGAFTMEGEPIWSVGGGGTQPCRPGPVGIHDIDADGQVEVVHFFKEGRIDAEANSMQDVVIQIRNGATGKVKLEGAPEALGKCSGKGPNWCHQRLMFADFRGTGSNRDFVVKLGSRILAFDSDLKLLWEYECPWTEYGHCPSYIPAVGDLDGDGKDEVNGGYFLLDHDGSLMWEHDIAPNMDSVAITQWDGGRMRAICSGHGIVMDERGRVIQNLGGIWVPHGQEVRVARFSDSDLEPQMVIRYNGHKPEVIVVNTKAQVVGRFSLNDSPNNTGMETVYCRGRDRAAVLYNGGMLWNPISGRSTCLPGLPPPSPQARMAWYHCIPAPRKDTDAEDIVIYNPWCDRI
jgi:hypothetical protein